MTPEEVFTLVNNLDVKESLRRFAPQWTTIAFDQSGNIVEVIRHKSAPTIASNRADLIRFPNTMQITCWPGRFADVSALTDEIRAAIESVAQAEHR